MRKITNMSYSKWARKIYKRLRLVIVPELVYSQILYEEILNHYCVPGLNWLDLGCGHNLLPSWRKKQEYELIKKTNLFIGMDYDFQSLVKNSITSLKIRGDITFLPFSENVFDIVTANMVFEHLNNPLVQLKEIHRILKPGGKLIFHTPNKYGYGVFFAQFLPSLIKDKIIYLLEGRTEEDVFPTYYLINTSRKIKELASMSGFDVKVIKNICSAAIFINIPVIVIFELLWIKLLMTERMKPLRTNIITVLEKPDSALP